MYVERRRRHKLPAGMKSIVIWKSVGSRGRLDMLRVNVWGIVHPHKNPGAYSYKSCVAAARGDEGGGHNYS